MAAAPFAASSIDRPPLAALHRGAASAIAHPPAGQAGARSVDGEAAEAAELLEELVAAQPAAPAALPPRAIS
jgi:hypothetical protein